MKDDVELTQRIGITFLRTQRVTRTPRMQTHLEYHTDDKCLRTQRASAHAHCMCAFAARAAQPHAVQAHAAQ
eukprot:1039203-Pleurochrysis_carterae.AAC.3